MSEWKLRFAFLPIFSGPKRIWLRFYWRRFMGTHYECEPLVEAVRVMRRPKARKPYMSELCRALTEVDAALSAVLGEEGNDRHKEAK